MDKFNQKDVCTSKVYYNSEAIVQSVISLEKRESTRDYYKCNICNKYHIYKIKDDHRIFNKKVVKEYRKEKIILLNKKTRPRRKR